MRAARPDYSRKTLDARKRTEKETSNAAPCKDEGVGSDSDATKRIEVSSAPTPKHKFGITQDGNITVGEAGGDERKWWEKW